jgi:hypothetical protein
MAAYIFDEILSKGIRAGKIPGRTVDAREWFRDVAKDTRVTPSRMISGNKSKLTSRTEIGSMYLFEYDAKHKAKLPYFDSFPLIFKIESYDDGFLGINLHYLPPRLRARLMDALYGLITDKRYDEKTALALSYKILNGAAKYNAFKPCVKRYLNTQVKSRFVEIDSVEWDIALFLPMARFNASLSKVYSDSRRKI